MGREMILLNLLSLQSLKSANLQYLFLLKMIQDELRLACSIHQILKNETITHKNEKI
jgi:hypothetical protein